MAPPKKDFWSRVFKVTPHQGCWLWLGPVDRNGYGQAWRDGRRGSAHRMAYVELVGPIDPDLELDHLCRVRSCVNPRHLEPVTHAENMRRSPTQRRLFCDRGHSMTDAYVKPDGGRNCRECRRAAVRRYRARIAA